MKICDRIVRLPLVATAVALLVWLGGEHAFAQARPRLPIEIRTLSSRPDLVSGGDTLLEVTTPPGTLHHELTVTVNGRDITSQLRVDVLKGQFRGVVDGLAVGNN